MLTMPHFNQGIHLFVCPFKKNVLFFFLFERKSFHAFLWPREEKRIFLKFSNNFQKVHNLMDTFVFSF